jgi:hypothetical protein
MSSIFGQNCQFYKLPEQKNCKCEQIIRNDETNMCTDGINSTN